MTRIRIELFGGASVIDTSGHRHALPSRNARALLALLAAAGGRPQGRARLATLMWDVVDLDHARASLRQTLFIVRRTLGDPAFVQTSESLALAPAVVDVDVWEFEALIARGTAEALQRAAEIYRADLLEGHVCGKGFAFDDWLAAERQRLRTVALGALGQVLDRALAADDREQARRIAGRILAIDPAEEMAHRALMRIHARERRFGQALRQFEWCRKVLQAELGVEPDVETRRLHAEIVRSRSFPAATGRAVGGGLQAQFAGA